MKIGIVAGGTGGHIYPGMALGEELIARGHEVVFFGSNDRMEKDVIPSKGFDFIGLDVYTTTGSILQKIKSFFSIIKAYNQCKSILKGFDMIIGFGNYISIPVIEAALKLGLKTVLHEQNSYVGKANRLLDKKVDLIIGCYKENKTQFKNPNLYISGNPQAAKAYNLKKDKKIISDLGLDPNKKTITIMMGSLGSMTVNEKILEYFDLTDGTYQIVYGAGNNGFETASKYTKNSEYIKIYKRIDGANLMVNSDLLVCRAGATTMAEIGAIGIPAIIIPSPYVANNHQYFNGKTLADAGAAILIEEKKLTSAVLNDTINKLVHDDEKLNEMSKCAIKLGNPNVMDDIIKLIESI